MESLAGSGNLRGSLVVSMSNARTTGSCIWKHGNGTTERVSAYGAVRFILDEGNIGRIGATPPHMVPVTHVDLAVNGNTYVIRYIVFSDVQNIVQLAGRARLSH